MKKIIGISLALVVSLASVAQSNEQIKNKNGVDIMPVKGEFAIGMNAIPVLNYVGNIFGLTSSNTSLSGNKFVSYFASNTLFGKYMLTDDNAIRAHLRIGQYNNSYTNEVFDDTQNDPDALVFDTFKRSFSVYNIGVGYEWRRGKTRLRGIYGGEVMYQYQKGSSDSYTYGNTFGMTNPAPTATSWFSSGSVISENPNAERIVSSTGGSFNGIGVRAFAGIEYYLAPKICLGTEFGWGIMGGFNGASSTITESWDPTANGTGAIVTDEFIGSTGRSMTIDTDNFGGSLYLMFYF